MLVLLYSIIRLRVMYRFLFKFSALLLFPLTCFAHEGADGDHHHHRTVSELAEEILSSDKEKAKGAVIYAGSFEPGDQAWPLIPKLVKVAASSDLELSREAILSIGEIKNQTTLGKVKQFPKAEIVKILEERLSYCKPDVSDAVEVDYCQIVLWASSKLTPHSSQMIAKLGKILSHRAYRTICIASCLIRRITGNAALNFSPYC